MKCKILHESNGRMRLHAEQTRMTLRQADILEAYLRQVPGVTEVKIYDRTCDAVVLYRGARTDLIRALAAFSYAASEALAPEHSSRALSREYEDKLVFAVCRHYFKKLFLPMPLRTVITLFRSVHYLRAGLSCLLHGKIQVPVLDATAIGVSMLRGDFATAGSIMFLLGIGDILDDLDFEVVVAALILHLVAVCIRRENRFPVVDDWRELWIGFEVAQEAQRRRALDGLVEEDLPRRRILDASAVVREQQSVVVLEVESVCLAREARRLAARGQHDRHAVLLDGE